jgi:hypothetical protein
LILGKIEVNERDVVGEAGAVAIEAIVVYISVRISTVPNR